MKATQSAGICLVLLLVGSASAANIVVPNSLANVEGETGNGLPFSNNWFGIPSLRYQQVYLASQFSALSGPSLITAIAFRPEGTDDGTAFSTTLPDVQIDLSTTSAAPGSLSATFANNVGVNDTVVHS